MATPDYQYDTAKSRTALAKGEAYSLLHELRMFNLELIQLLKLIGAGDSPATKELVEQIFKHAMAFDEKMKALVFVSPNPGSESEPKS